MNQTQRVLRVAGSRTTRVVAGIWGDRIPLYYVSEYPKSGGTWLAKMLADYLEVALPQNNMFPILKTSVVHNHWKYSPYLKNAVYLIRDGRDLVVSIYFTCLRMLENDNDGSARKYLAKRFPPFGNQPVYLSIDHLAHSQA